MAPDLDPRGTALPVGPDPGSVLVDIDGEHVVVQTAGDDIVSLQVAMDVSARVEPWADDALLFASLGAPGDTSVERRGGALHGRRRIVDPTPGSLRRGCADLARLVVDLRARLGAGADAAGAVPEPLEESVAREELAQVEGPRFADTTALRASLADVAVAEPPRVTVRAVQPAWHRSGAEGAGDYSIQPGMRLRLLADAVDGRACVVFDNGTVMYTDPAGLTRLP